MCCDLGNETALSDSMRPVDFPQQDIRDRGLQAGAIPSLDVAHFSRRQQMPQSSYLPQICSRQRHGPKHQQQWLGA